MAVIRKPTISGMVQDALSEEMFGLVNEGYSVYLRNGKDGAIHVTIGTEDGELEYSMCIPVYYVEYAVDPYNAVKSSFDYAKKKLREKEGKQ